MRFNKGNMKGPFMVSICGAKMALRNPVKIGPEYPKCVCMCMCLCLCVCALPKMDPLPYSSPIAYFYNILVSIQLPTRYPLMKTLET